MLGALTGALIVIPITTVEAGAGLVAVGAAAGGLVGYRRRKSRAFFYFAIACALILSTIISFSMFR